MRRLSNIIGKRYLWLGLGYLWRKCEEAVRFRVRFGSRINRIS